MFIAAERTIDIYSLLPIIDEHFQIFWIHGYDFQKIFRIYGLYFYDLNVMTPYLGN